MFLVDKMIQNYKDKKKARESSNNTTSMIKTPFSARKQEIFKPLKTVLPTKTSGEMTANSRGREAANSRGSEIFDRGTINVPKKPVGEIANGSKPTMREREDKSQRSNLTKIPNKLTKEKIDDKGKG